MHKPVVFISHITEEREVAGALKDLIDGSFLGMIEVFLSSDPSSIQVGQRWLDSITHALKACDVEIIIASPHSMYRPWINFEAGAGWVRDIPVIPLCHSGMTPTKLPYPMRALQATTATDAAQLKLIFPVLAKAIGCELPEIDFSDFISAVTQFEQTSREIAVMSARSSVAPAAGLSQYEFATLVAIGEATEPCDDSSISVFRVREELEKLGFTRMAVSIALASLSRRVLVESVRETDWNNQQYTVVRLTPEGWSWLESNQDRLVLHRNPSVESDAAPVASETIPF